jgi:hypothetical protein
MLIPTTDAPPEWISEDALNLKSFLDSTTGVKLAQLLSYFAPALLDGEHKNKTLVASGELKGYSSAIEIIFSLRTSRPKESEPKADNYPSLEDESAWKDETTTNPT